MQSLAGANRGVMQTMDFLTELIFLKGKKLHVFCKNNSIRKFVNDGVVQNTRYTRALPCGRIQ